MQGSGVHLLVGGSDLLVAVTHDIKTQAENYLEMINNALKVMQILIIIPYYNVPAIDIYYRLSLIYIEECSY